MAKKADYYGFDDAKNIVRAPKVYLSSDEIDLGGSAGWQAASGEQGEQSILVMNKNGSTEYPGTGIGVLFSVRSTGSAEFQLYQDGSNDLYVAGRSSEKVYFPWKKLAKQETVDSVSQDVRTANDDIKQLRSDVISAGNHISFATYNINETIAAGQTFTYTTDTIADKQDVIAVSLEYTGTGLIASGGVSGKKRIVVTVYNGSTGSTKLGSVHIAILR